MLGSNAGSARGRAVTMVSQISAKTGGATPLPAALPLSSYQPPNRQHRSAQVPRPSLPVQPTHTHTPAVSAQLQMDHHNRNAMRGHAGPLADVETPSLRLFQPSAPGLVSREPSLLFTLRRLATRPPLSTHHLASPAARDAFHSSTRYTVLVAARPRSHSRHPQCLTTGSNESAKASSLTLPRKPACPSTWGWATCSVLG
jgi:hypothetical protein